MDLIAHTMSLPGQSEACRVACESRTLLGSIYTGYSYTDSHSELLVPDIALLLLDRIPETGIVGMLVSLTKI